MVIGEESGGGCVDNMVHWNGTWRGIMYRRILLGRRARWWWSRRHAASDDASMHARNPRNRVSINGTEGKHWSPEPKTREIIVIHHTAGREPLTRHYTGRITTWRSCRLLAPASTDDRTGTAAAPWLRCDTMAVCELVCTELRQRRAPVTPAVSREAKTSATVQQKQVTSATLTTACGVSTCYAGGTRAGR